MADNLQDPAVKPATPWPAAGASARPACDQERPTVSNMLMRSRIARHAAVALLLLVIPHAVYHFLWFGPGHQVLGNDYTDIQPAQQMMFMQRMREGVFPLWSPDDSGGLPFAAYLFSGQYSPVTWIMMLLDSTFAGRQLDILTHWRLLLMSMAAYFVFLNLRRFDLATLPALCGALVFVFNMRLLDAFRYGMALDVIVWLPVLLYVVECMARAPRVSLCLLCAAVHYMLLVPGHMQEGMYCMVFAWLVLAVRGWCHVRDTSAGRRLRAFSARVLWFGSGQLLGVGLSAVMWVVVLSDVVPLWTQRTSGGPEYYFMHHLTWAGLLYNMCLPWFADVGSAFYATQLAVLVMAIGVSRLFTGRGTPSSAHRVTLACFACGLLFCVLYALGPLTHMATVVNDLAPWMKMFRNPGRVMSVGMFCAAAVAAFGFEWLLCGPRRCARLFLYGCLGYAAVGVVLAAGVIGGWIDVRPHHVALPLLWNIPKYSPAIIHGDAAMPLTMAGVIAAVALANALFVWLRHRGVLARSLAGLCLLGTGLAEVGIYHRRGTWMAPHAVAAAGEQVRAEGGDYVVAQPAAFAYCRDPRALVSWANVPARLREFLRRGGEPARWIFYRDAPECPMPQAYVTPVVHLADGGALDALARLDPRRASVVDVTDPANAAAKHDAALLSLAADSASPSTHCSAVQHSEITLERAGPNTVTFSVRSAVPGLFHYTDAYASGWRVWVDGRRSKLYRVNHLFKGVVLNRGLHRVCFQYDPPSFRLGWCLSVISCCVMASLVGACQAATGRGRLAGAVLGAGLGCAGGSLATDCIHNLAGFSERVEIAAAAADGGGDGPIRASAGTPRDVPEPTSRRHLPPFIGTRSRPSPRTANCDTATTNQFSDPTCSPIHGRQSPARLTLHPQRRRGPAVSGEAVVTRVKILGTLGACGCTCLLWGCAATHQDEMTFLKAKDHIAPGTTYRMAPPDVIRIHSPQAPEVDSVVRVRPDGTVHLRLLGDVRLAGLTSREAAAKLQKELRVYYRDPVVHVTVEQPTSNVFYLFGEIAGSGLGRGGASRRLTGRDTLLDVLTADPPSPNAWLSQIKVIRPADDPEENQEMVIDFQHMITTGDLRKNILLQEGDIVYVPPTPLAWIGYRISELLQPVGPAIQAYTTPATVISADDVYKDDNESEGNANLLGRITIP